VGRGCDIRIGVWDRYVVTLFFAHVRGALIGEVALCRGNPFCVEVS